MIGQTVSHYRIFEQLGGGGMGIVYKAEDTSLKRTVALKFLPPTLTLDPEAQERFVHEARAASALDHPNICAIHDIGRTDDGRMFIVMACYDGETLKKKLERGALDIDLALDIAIQVATGLSRAHESGIVHRDVKPANIMITSHGEVKILDFGLAKLAGGTLLTRSGTTMGTAAYMSPEQASSGQVDERTDVWSLGVVLYEMLAGRRPFESDFEQALIYSILNEQPRPLRTIRPEVPEVVEMIIEKALAKEAEDRYRKVGELLSDLTVARGTAEAGGTIAVAQALERKRRNKRVRTFRIAGAALVLLAAGLFVAAPLIEDQAIASDPKRIAFISFENQTGDRSFDNLQLAIPTLLTTSLDESKFFRVTTWDRIRGTLRLMGKEDVQFIDKELGLELCRRLNVQALALGSFTRAGNLFMTSVQVVDSRSGDPLMQTVRVDGRGVESILRTQVDEIAKQVSRGLGVSRWATGSSLKPVQQLTTSSQEALNFYVRGEYEFDRLHWPEAARNFQLAVKSDSTFASAWAFLASALRYAGDYSSGDTSGKAFAVAQAVRNAPRASEREQWHIGVLDPALRARLYGGRPDSWLAYWQKLVQRFPDDARAHQEVGLQLYLQKRYNEAADHFVIAAPVIVQSWNLAMYMYMYSNQIDKAIEAGKQYAICDPGEANPIDGMGECLWYAGRFDEAIAQFEKAAEVDPKLAASKHASIGQLRFLKEEYEDALPCFDRANDPWWKAFTLVWTGRLREAERELGKLKRTQETQWLRAWIAYESGAWDKARTLLEGWARQVCSPDERPSCRMYVDYCLGLIDLKQARMDSVRMRLDSMASMLNEASDAIDSIEMPVQFALYGKALRAAYLVAAGRPAEIDPNWGAGPRSWPSELDSSHGAASRPVHTWGGPRPSPGAKDFWVPVVADVVPQGYLQRGMIDSAIISYERAVDRKIDYLCPILPRYHYRLAKLYDQKGMKEKAIHQYAIFLGLWGKADPIFPEPADARMRLAKLKAL